MGKRIKGYVARCLCILLLLLLPVNLTACSSGGQVADGQKKETSEDAGKKKDQTKEDKAKEEIPEDLLPGGDTPGADADTSGNGADSQAEAGVYDAGNTSTGNAPKGNSAKNKTAGSVDSSQGAGESSQVQKDTVDITFEIEASAAESYGYALSYSDSLSLGKGATVYDALKACGVDYSGSSYITSIGGLAEKACGSMSGWKYYVNGKEPGMACNQYTLQDGDAVKWSYVLKP